MTEPIRMHHILTEMWCCGRLDPDEFREAFLELGFWEEDFPSEGFEIMCDRFGEMGSSAWARFMDLTISINAGEMAELLYRTDDGEEAIPHALIEAAAIAPMEFESLTMDRVELRREAMRRLAASDAEGGFRMENP